MSKYEYPEGMSADDRRKYRRDARRGGTAPTQTIAKDPTTITPRRAKAPVAMVPQQSEDGLGFDNQPEYIEQLLEMGLTNNNQLGKGYAISIERKPSIDQMLLKFKDRWDMIPTTFRFISKAVIIFGPIPE